jgi:preprotein translocase subunit Sec63
MEGFELVAVVVFFLIGYWIVDFFWPRKKAGAAPAAAAAEATPWNEVLGLSRDASPEQIREAYLAKSAEHHPDRAFDQRPEAREAALRRTRELNDAFEQAMKGR